MNTSVYPNTPIMGSQERHSLVKKISFIFLFALAQLSPLSTHAQTNSCVQKSLVLQSVERVTETTSAEAASFKNLQDAFEKRRADLGPGVSASEIWVTAMSSELLSQLTSAAYASSAAVSNLGLAVDMNACTIDCSNYTAIEPSSTSAEMTAFNDLIAAFNVVVTNVESDVSKDLGGGVTGSAVQNEIGNRNRSLSKLSDLLNIHSQNIAGRYKFGKTYCASPSSKATPTSSGLNELSKRLAGKILLQVEAHGEAWYVKPDTGKRVYLKDGAAAYELMRYDGLGISNIDLANVPVAESVAALKTAPGACIEGSVGKRIRGKVLLQVQSHGEAWYVDPDKCRRLYLKDGESAYILMHDLGLGISNKDISNITAETQ